MGRKEEQFHQQLQLLKYEAAAAGLDARIEAEEAAMRVRVLRALKP